MTAFHDHPIIRDHLQKYERFKLPLEEWYQEKLRVLPSSQMQQWQLESIVNQYVGELLWERATRPYYCIHPNIVSQLCRIDFSKIPSTMIAMPKPFDMVCVRLREENPLLSIENGRYYLKTMLAWRRQSNTEIVVNEHDIYEIKNEGMMFWLNYGETDFINNEISFPVLMYKIFPVIEGKSIEDVFDELPETPTVNEGVRVPMEFVKNCVRLFLSVGFLSQCNNFPFEFDVLSKDRAKYQIGDKETKDRCIDRAKRRGKVGWLVGTDGMFQGSRTTKPGGEGRQLNYAHIRGGHVSFYWCGPKSNPRLEPRWIAPTTVRPDLPFKTDGTL